LRALSSFATRRQHHGPMSSVKAPGSGRGQPF
jgi:hypothetical protein